MTANEAVLNVPEATRGLSEQENRTGSVTLRLVVGDPEVTAEIERIAAGPDRDRYVRAALRIGVLCLRQARGEVDAAQIKSAGETLVADLRELLTERAASMTGDLVKTFAHYLDPDSGMVHQRMKALLDHDGELDRVLAAHIGGDQSALAKTLAAHVGETSPLFSLLSPDAADGLKARLGRDIEELLAGHRGRLAREFSLDEPSSALSRLVREVEDRQAKLGTDVKGQVEVLKRELTLDRPDSALSRMHSMLQSTQGQIDKHLTLDADDSALARVRRELMAAIDTLGKANTGFQAEVREALVAMQARKQEAARGTAHGNDFEAQAGAVLAAEAARKGDVYEACGNTTGVIRGCKVGDHLIEMGADSRAAGARIACEAKQKAGVSLRDALAEIDKARKNREAQVGIFIYSARVAPDGLDALARYGDDIVVVWDADDPATDVALQAAYSLARGMTASTCAADEATASSLREINLAARVIEKQICFLAEVNKQAKTIESHGKKIVNRTERMQAELEREIERIDEQVRALGAVEPA